MNRLITLHDIRARAIRVGMDILEFIHKRQTKDLRNLDAWTDSSGTIQFRPRSACNRELKGWQPVFRTLINVGDV